MQLLCRSRFGGPPALGGGHSRHHHRCVDAGDVAYCGYGGRPSFLEGCTACTIADVMVPVTPGLPAAEGDRVAKDGEAEGDEADEGRIAKGGEAKGLGDEAEGKRVAEGEAIGDEAGGDRAAKGGAAKGVEAESVPELLKP